MAEMCDPRKTGSCGWKFVSLRSAGHTVSPCLKNPKDKRPQLRFLCQSLTHMPLLRWHYTNSFIIYTYYKYIYMCMHTHTHVLIYIFFPLQPGTKLRALCTPGTHSTSGLHTLPRNRVVILSFWDRALLRIHSQCGPTLTILLPQPSKCYDYRCLPPHLAPLLLFLACWESPGAFPLPVATSAWLRGWGCACLGLKAHLHHESLLHSPGPESLSNPVSSLTWAASSHTMDFPGII